MRQENGKTPSVLRTSPPLKREREKGVKQNLLPFEGDD